MERTDRSHKWKEENLFNVIELPVKVDIVDGADGLELHEIIFALQYSADHLRSTDLFRAKYFDRLVAKYQSIQRARLLQIKQYFHDRFAQGGYSHRKEGAKNQDHS